MSEITKNAKSAGADEARGGRYDAVIVGAGTAGLSVALVLYGGEPRNAPSPGAHGFFTCDSVSLRELPEIGREQLAPYEGAELKAPSAGDGGAAAGVAEEAAVGGLR